MREHTVSTEERRLLRRLAGASGANLALQLFSTALGLVTGVVLGRFLGASELGQYAFGLAVANVLAVVAKLGFETLLVREIPVARSGGRWGVVGGLVSFAERASASAALGLGLLALAWGWWALDRGTFLVLAWAVPLLVGMSGSSLRAAALRGLDRVVLAQVPVLFVRPVLFLLLLVAVVGPGADGARAMAVHAAAYLTAWCIGVVVWRAVRPTEIAVAAKVTAASAWLSAAVPLVLLAGLQIINNQVDLLMLKGLASDAETGIYSVVGQLARATAMVLTVVNGIVAPRYAGLHVRGELEALQRLVTGSAAGITAITLPAAALLVAVGPFVLSLYGDEFVAGQGALTVLVLANVVNALAGSVGVLLVMTGHEREVAALTAATIGLNAALNWVLVPAHGVVGAAVASAVSMVIWNVVLVVRVRVLLGIDSTAVGWAVRRLVRRTRP